MEQKDYLLREIEKIGWIMRAIHQKAFGGRETLAISITDQMEAAREMLFSESGFNMEKFLALDREESNEYISGFEGFSPENLELLADFISEIALISQTDHSKKYLEKAVQLYELTTSKSKLFSLEREKKMESVRNALQ